MRLRLRLFLAAVVVALSAAGARSSGLHDGHRDAADLVLLKTRVKQFAIEKIQLPGEELPESFRVTVNYDGQQKVLRLKRHSWRARHARLLIQGGNGELAAQDLPPARTYRGWVDGEPGSSVAASLVSRGLYARVIPPGAPSWSVRPLSELDPDSPRESHFIYSQADVAPLSCGHGDGIDLPEQPAPLPPTSAARGGGGAATCTLKVADIAFDSDYEFYERKCDSNTDTCVEVVETGLNITNLMYIRDVKIFHRLSVLVIRTDPAADFYAQFPDASDFGAMLVAFRSEWNANMQDEDYDVAYLLTGKPKPNYGGLAYVGVVCSSSRYGMGIGGWGYEGIFRHEVGHNWGAGHSCGAERRYIMCGNSIDAISAYNIRVMSNHRDSRSCLDEIPHESDPEPPFARLDPVVMLEGEGPVAIHVVEGDSDFNCDRLSLGRFDSQSAFGAAIQILDPADPEEPAALLYSPRSGFVGTDYFRYSVEDETGFETESTVLVQITPRALVAYFKLDETEGDEASDASGNDHEGELRDDLSFDTNATAGRFGGALQFNGVDGEYVSLGDDAAFDLRRGMTVAAWFRVDAFANGGETIIGKGSSAWRLKRDGTNSTLKFTGTGLSVAGSTDGAVRGAIPVDDGAWHHAAGVYDGTRIYLYVDGRLDRSAPASGRIETNSSSVRIGDDRWNGPIDDVRIYNFGLADLEIEALHRDARVENRSPSEGAGGIVPGARLSWLEAPSATAHDVYFGADQTAVSTATTASPEYQGRRSPSFFSPTIEPEQTYFWRVDEVQSGIAQRGDVFSFTSAFASTGFNEPPLNAQSYSPGPGDVELGFRTTSAPTQGGSPFVGVVETGSTPTTPIFSHRSMRATTTFDAVDLSERGPVVVSLQLQARSTGYEVEDLLDVYATDGIETRSLVHLDGGAALTQRAGTGYGTFMASLPAGWNEASLVLSTSSNSGSGNERYDFDNIGFSCQRPFRVIAFTNFNEPEEGADTYVPGAASAELGFRTTRTATGGANPYVGVVDTTVGSSFLSHRSARATTTFDSVSLNGWADVKVVVVLRVWDTGYEAEDRLEAFVTDGESRVDLLALDGDSGLDGLADGEYTSFSAPVPGEWRKVSLVVSTSSNSQSASERYDFRSVELLSTSSSGSCGDDVPPPPQLLRGDANADGNFDLSDGILVLNYLFAGATLTCLDAADANDSGVVDITDGISVFGFLFLGAEPPPAPGQFFCGLDPTEDPLGCESFSVCP